MRFRHNLLSTTMWSGLAGGAFAASAPVLAADLVVKAPNYEVLAPAVDGPNGKVEGFGGSLANKTIYGAKGSFSVPLGRSFGVQIDGAGGSFDGSGFGSVGGHLFWRNPAQGLIGIYASHTEWDRFGGARVSQVAGEAEWYLGRWTVQGIAGIESGNNATRTTTTTTALDPFGAVQIATLTESYDVKSRFFNQINVAYYVQDNWKVFAGHRYLGGRNAAAFGTEVAMSLGGGRMASLFVEGRAGEDNFRGVWGGVKFYFGRNDKSLIQRHRQDDPIDWAPDTLFSLVNSFVRNGTTAVTTPACPPGEIYVIGSGCV